MWKCSIQHLQRTQQGQSLVMKKNTTACDGARVELAHQEKSMPCNGLWKKCLAQGATDMHASLWVFKYVAPFSCTHMCHTCEKARHDDKFILAKALNMQLNTRMCPNKKMNKAQAVCAIWSLSATALLHVPHHSFISWTWLLQYGSWSMKMMELVS